MFVAHDIVLDVAFATAKPRLRNLMDRGLTSASRAAYDDGLATVVRVGPFGDVPGVSRLVNVRFLEPWERDGDMITALRWEAVGVTGDLFPVLDADISLSLAGPDRTRLALVGIYRPPLGPLGAAIDRVVMHRVADATVRAIVQTIADSLTQPGLAAEPQPSCDSPLLFRPAREPGAP
jgi:hypothetical protein